MKQGFGAKVAQILDLRGKGAKNQQMADHREGRPGLRHKKVVLTRPPAQLAEDARLLSDAYGAVPVRSPLIQIEAPTAAQRMALTETWAEVEAGRVDALIFSSANSVRHAAQLLFGGSALVVPERLHVFTIGRVSAELLEQYGVTGVVAGPGTAQQLAEQLLWDDSLAQGTVVLFRAEQGRNESLELLRRGGIDARLAVTHRKVRTALDALPLQEMRTAHWLTFASPSAVQAYDAMLSDAMFSNAGPCPKEVRVGCIGPTTAAACAALGISVQVVPREPRMSALFESMAAPVG